MNEWIIEQMHKQVNEYMNNKKVIFGSEKF